MARSLTKDIRRSPLEDSQRRYEEAATVIGACLDPAEGETDPRGSYAVMKHWYRHAATWAPNPSRTDMKKVRKNLRTLYKRDKPHTPGIPLATHIYPFQVDYATPW